MFYKDITLMGLSQCYRCKQKNKWNVNWSCDMWILKENGHHYCDECKKELEKNKK